jgi:tetratricopeptide (TPR) repeat protein
MLGGFSITHDGREVVLGRNKSAKFIKVLQIVWLAGDRGISKGQLVSRIYSDQELLTNLSNSLNNLFYQMRKQMVKSGLPDYEYVVKKDSMFMIDEKTEIITDVGLFIDFCSKGDRASDTEEKLAYYIKAFDIYIGELLPENASEVQVITDSALLHKRYARVVQWLGDYYKDQKNYPQMYRIYEKAAKIYPADDWQAGQIDSLVSREMYKDAYDLYDKTVRYYKEELGI